MKSFPVRIALSACTIFTVTMLIWCLLGLLFAGPEYGLIVTLTLFVACAGIAILRGIWFTDKLVKRLVYPARIFGFGVTAFVVLAACARAGSWFPVEEAGPWVSFTVIYLVILMAFCVGYQIHFKRTVGSFDAALRAYHDRMDQQ